MTTETKISELNANTDQILEVLNEILDILGATKLVVHFDTLTDDFEIADLTYFRSQSFGHLPVPVREGYDFAGWYTYHYDGVYRNEIEDYSTVISQGRITLYAKWEPSYVTVMLDPGENGHVNKTSISVRPGYAFGKALEDVKPNWAGKEFNTWLWIDTDDPLETTLSITPESILSTSMLDEDGICRLSAEWTNYKFNVSAYYIYGEFKNTKSGSPVSAEFKNIYANQLYNTVPTFAADLKRRDKYDVTGHKFIGMSYTKNCQDVSEIERTMTVFDNTVLYAAWKPYSYKLKYYLNTNNEQYLLSAQTLNADEVTDLIPVRELVGEKIANEFTTWTKGSADGAHSKMINILTNAQDEKPVCNLVSTDNGYASIYFGINTDTLLNGVRVRHYLSAMPAQDGLPPGTIQLDNRLPEGADNFRAWDDWAFVNLRDGIEEPEYVENDEVQMTAYDMYLFMCEQTTTDVPNVYHRTYSIKRVTPIKYTISETGGKNLQGGANNVIFYYGDLNNNPFTATKTVTAKKAAKKLTWQLLGNNFQTTYRYKTNLDVSPLSVLETSRTEDNSIVESVLHDSTELTYYPVSALTSKLTENFRLSIECDSVLSNNQTFETYKDISVWYKTAKLSAVLPVIGIPPLPVSAPFDKDIYLSNLSGCGIFENRSINENSMCNIDSLSVMNLSAGEEILEEHGVLNICSCEIGGGRPIPHPELSCKLSIGTEPCKYMLEITKLPTKIDYSEMDSEIDLAGISGVIHCGSNSYPRAMSCGVTEISCFSTDFYNFYSNSGTAKIPVYCVYDFTQTETAPGTDGNFPPWKPYIEGYSAAAESFFNINIITGTNVLSLQLSTTKNDTVIDFSRLIPKYGGVTYEIDFDNNNAHISTITGKKAISHKYASPGLHTAVIRTNKNIAGNGLANAVYCSAGVANTQDFAYYMAGIVGPCIPSYLLAGTTTAAYKRISAGIRGNIEICENAFLNNKALTAVVLPYDLDKFTIGKNAFRNCSAFTRFEVPNSEVLVSDVFNKYALAYAEISAKWESIVAAAQSTSYDVSQTTLSNLGPLSSADLTLHSVCDISGTGGVSSYASTNRGILRVASSIMAISSANEIATALSNANYTFANLDVINVFPSLANISDKYCAIVLSSSKYAIIDNIGYNAGFITSTDLRDWFSGGATTNILPNAYVITNIQTGSGTSIDNTRYSRYQYATNLSTVDYDYLAKLANRPGLYTKSATSNKVRMFGQSSIKMELTFSRKVFHYNTTTGNISLSSQASNFSKQVRFTLPHDRSKILTATIQYGFKGISITDGKTLNDILQGRTNRSAKYNLSAVVSSSIPFVGKVTYPSGGSYLSAYINIEQPAIGGTSLIDNHSGDTLAGCDWNVLSTIRLQRKITFEIKAPGIFLNLSGTTSTNNSMHQTSGQDWTYNCTPYTFTEDFRFPEAEIKIGQLAFANTNIQAVDLEAITNKNQKIDNYAFANMGKLQIVDFKSSTSSIITSLGISAFGSNDKLQIVNELSSTTVAVIGNYAFNNCKLINDLAFSRNLETIGTSTFANCNAISTVKIPNSVTKIGATAFSNCNALSNVYIEIPNLAEEIQLSCGTTIFINTDHDTTPAQTGKTISQLSVTFVDNLSTTVPPEDKPAFDDAVALTGDSSLGFGIGKYNTSTKAWEYSIQVAKENNLIRGLS